ncbi:hypothetical protein NXY28_17855 [Bacteroides thetaiotaomicron]|nr:hypothetical protein NXY28_17855 [Bacteroides thetaiotaomicron]
MKRNLRFLAGAFLLTATALFTGCNSDDDFLMNPQTDSVTPETRANFNDDGTTTITFDDFDETFMAVSPKAENYYTLYGYTAENQIREIYDPDFVFVSDMNTVTNSYGAYTEFSSGAIALSKYNYRSDSAAGKTSGTNWWYTWENQCSVYNTASTDRPIQGQVTAAPILLLYTATLISEIRSGWPNLNSILTPLANSRVYGIVTQHIPMV